MPTDIIIYALVAAGLILWLRSLLGTRNGSERSRPNPFATPPSDATARPVATVNVAGNGQPAVRLSGPADLQQGLDRNMAISGPQTEQGLLAIARLDRAFNLPHFLHGAQDAFVMIVEAFAHGDTATLRDLLSPSVFQAFSDVIDQRAKNGERATVEIHAVRRAEIIDAKADARIATITVRFVTDETYVVRDQAEKIIQGNPDRVTEAIDIWTFSRDLRARTPNWLLSETRDADAAAGSGTIVVPDSV